MSAQIRVLDVSLDGSASVAPTSQLARPPAGQLRWIDIQAATESALEELGKQFSFHPLALEDCLHLDQRPKLEEYGEYLFIVVHGFLCPTGDPRSLDLVEVHCFLGPNYLVTVHSSSIPALDVVWKRLEGDLQLARKGADFMFYLVTDEVIDANFAIIDLISDFIEQVENKVFEQSTPSELNYIIALKRSLAVMRRVLSPARDVFGLLVKRSGSQISERTSIYLRDVYDHLVRISESIDASRDILGNTLDAYLSMLSNRTNEIMKRLTLLSAVFLPLTFITGFFGQNFAHLPFDSDALMFTMFGACIVIPSTMVILFRRSGWF